MLGWKGHGQVPAVDSPGSQTVCICRARCWQPGVRTPTPSGVSEDCLYLNVFVPQNVVSLSRCWVCPESCPLATPRPHSFQHRPLISTQVMTPALSLLGLMAESELRVLPAPTRLCLLLATSSRPVHTGQCLPRAVLWGP